MDRKRCGSSSKPSIDKKKARHVQTAESPIRNVEASTKRKLGPEHECIVTKRCKYNEDETLCNDVNQAPVVYETQRSSIDKPDTYNHWRTKCSEKVKIKKVNVLDEGFTARYTDMYFSILDEVSLEGLDGITLEALWKRLSVAVNPPLILNTKFKKFAWKIICLTKNIKIYNLNEPRPDLVIFDYNQYIDSDSGIICENKIPDDIYPFKCINDKHRGVIGSCATYESRKNVTKSLKSLSLFAAEKYGNTLVLVASQQLRRCALFSPFSDPNVELTDMHYCILERIARSRRLGECTHGKNSIQSIIKDAKQIFYITKILMDAHMISKQYFYAKQPGTNNTGSLYHLARLHKDHKIKTEMLTEHIVDILKDQPNYRIEYAELYKMLGSRNLFKKICKTQEFKRFVKTDLHYAYRDIYPDAEVSEWKHKSSEREKTIRVLELIDPHVNVSANWFEESTEKVEGIDRHQRDLRGISLSRTLLNQAYNILFEFGLGGCSPWDLKHIMTVDYYTSRAIIKLLEKRNLLDTKRVEVGRIHMVKYYPRCLNITEVSEKHEDIVNKTKYMGPRIKNSLPIMSTLLKNTTSKDSKTDSDCTGICEDFQTIKPCECFPLKSAIIKDWRVISYERDKCNLAPLLLLKGAQITIDSMFLHEKVLEPVNVNYDTFVISDDINSCLNILIKHDRQIITDGMKQSKALLIEALTGDFSKVQPRLQEEDPHDLLVLSGLGDLQTEAQKTVKTEIKKPEDKNVISDKSEMFVKLDWYMGSKPVLEKEHTSEDGYNIMIISSTPAKNNKKPGSIYKPVAKNMALRYLRRVNLIITTVNKERIVESRIKLKHIVASVEKEEGYEGTVDRKTIEKIYAVLIEEGYMKAYIIIMKSDGMTYRLHLICTLDVNPEDSELMSVIEHTKLIRFHSEQKLAKATIVKAIPSEQDIERSISELKELNAIVPTSYKYSCFMGKEYGYAPKFMRMQTLHEFMFYLIYGDVPSEPIQQNELRELLSANDIELDEKDVKYLPPVYTKDISWKMFVKPLPKHLGWESGWCLLCDLFVRMPLSLFVRLHNIRFVIPTMNSYLEHPVKKHILIKCLPQDIRSGLLNKRLYRYDIREILNRLCYVGLAQYGPRNSRDNDQIFIYLNRNAVLYDTTTSEKGFHHVSKKVYERRDFKFSSMSDVEGYWYQLWSISMYTPLGSRSAVAGKMMTVEQLTTKPEMVDSLKGQNQKTAQERDVGYLPGDHLGAAGYDSATWVHLKRNWLWPKKIKKEPDVKHVKELITGLRKKKMDKVPLRPMHLGSLKTKAGFQETLQVKSKRISKWQAQPKSNKKKHIRAVKVVQRKRAPRKRYYDKVDLNILRITQRKRSDWTEHEDTMLLLCKMASTYLCPISRKHFIPSTVLRDVLHRICPRTKGKTSTMCIRRINWLFHSREIKEGNTAAAEYLTKNIFITQHFSKLRDAAVAPNSKVKESDLFAAYIYLVYYMFTHKEIRKSTLKPFDMRIHQDYLTPENVRKYNWTNPEGVCYYKNPMNKDDIICDNIKSVLHSSLSCDENKIALACQLYRAYQSFPPDLLKITITTLKEQQLLAAKKVTKRKQNANEPILTPSPYHFSCLYIYTQLTDYPNKVFPETYEFLSSLKKYGKYGELYDQRVYLKQGHNFGLCEIYNHMQPEFTFDIPDKVVVLNPQIKDHTELINELALRYQYLMTHKKFTDDLEEIDVFPPDSSDTSSEEPNSPIIQVSPRKKLRPTITVPEIVQKVIKAYDSQDQTEKDYLESQINHDLQTLQDNMDSDEDSTPDPIPKMGPEEKVAPRLHSTKEELEVLVKTETLEAANNVKPTAEDQLETLPPLSKLFRFEDSVEVLTLAEIKEAMMDPSEDPKRQVPYITDLSVLLSRGLFPETQFNDNEEWLSRLHSHFKVKLPKPKLSFEEDISSNSLYNYFQKDHVDVASQLLARIKKGYIVPEHCANDTTIEKEFVNKWGNNEKGLTLIKQLTQFILESEELGVTVVQIKTKFKTCNCGIFLSEALTFLRENNVIMQVGITSIIFVHFNYKKPWFLKTYILTNEDKEKIKNIKDSKLNDEVEQGEIPDPTHQQIVKVMPWIKINGNLNIHVYKKWLGIIMSYCLKFPKVPLKKLIRRFHYVKPVDIYFLLEHLQMLGCLRLCVAIKNTVNIFSRISETKIVDASITDNFEEIHVHTSTTAALRLGCFMVVLDSKIHLLI